MHIPNRTGNAGRVRHVHFKAQKIVSPLHESAAFVSDERAVPLCRRHCGKTLAEIPGAPSGRRLPWYLSCRSQDAPAGGKIFEPQAATLSKKLDNDGIS
jgi:hypothetical protein